MSNGKLSLRCGPPLISVQVRSRREAKIFYKNKISRGKGIISTKYYCGGDINENDCNGKI